MMRSEYMNQKRRDLVDLLAEGYLSEHEAKCLIYIADKDDVESRELENVLYLRQPEVSIAVQGLVDKGLIGKHEKNKDGRGRPTKIYNLERPIEEVIDDVVEDLESRIENLRDKKIELKELRADLF
ncbi:MAG: hypothetical protein R6W73_08395 [Candidatus Saliniplasma sp.]